MRKSKGTHPLTPQGLIAELLKAVGGDERGSLRRLRDELGTSFTQVRRLLDPGGDPRWSSLEKATEALGRLQKKSLKVRIVIVEDAQDTGHDS